MSVSTKTAICTAQRGQRHCSRSFEDGLCSNFTILTHNISISSSIDLFPRNLVILLQVSYRPRASNLHLYRRVQKPELQRKLHPLRFQADCGPTTSPIHHSRLRHLRNSSIEGAVTQAALQDGPSTRTNSSSSTTVHPPRADHKVTLSTLPSRPYLPSDLCTRHVHLHRAAPDTSHPDTTLRRHTARIPSTSHSFGTIQLRHLRRIQK